MKRKQLGFKQALEIVIKKLQELHEENLVLEVEKIKNKLL